MLQRSFVRSFSISYIKIHTQTHSHCAHKQDLQSNERHTYTTAERRKNIRVSFSMKLNLLITKKAYVDRYACCRHVFVSVVCVCLCLCCYVYTRLSISYSQFIGAMIFGAVIEMASYMVVICVYGVRSTFHIAI